MKNMTIKMLVLISTIIISFGSFANRTHIYVTAAFAETTWYYYCTTQSDTVILHKPIGETLPRWTKPDGNDIFADSAIVTVANQGFWSFVGDNTDAKGLFIYFSTAAPVAPLASDTTMCGSGAFNLVLNAQNTTNYCTYAWPGTTTTTQTRVVTTPGIYWLNVTNACGTVTDSIHVYQKSTTLPNLGPDTNLCNGNTINLSVGTGYNYYLWSPNTTATNQNIAITAPGTYWVEVANVCIGTKRDSVIVGSFTTPTPNLGADRNICQGTTVTLNPGTYQRYLWYNGQTTPTVTVGAGTYWMEAWNGSCRALSNTIHLTQVVPTPESICFVEFDTTTLKNNIHWIPTLPANTDSVHVYKEISLNNWSLIGSVPSAVNHFIDINSAPQSQSYSYKIATIDSCGNESTKSTAHTTITLLRAYDQPSNTYGFTWSSYQGISASEYLLFGVTATGTATQLGSVPGNLNFYNYSNPSSTYIQYFVAFETPSCDGTKVNTLVKSNYVSAVNTSITDYQSANLTVYPNPATDQLTIEMEGNNTELKFNIINSIGQVIFEGSVTDKCVVNTSAFAAGVYMIKLESGTVIKFVK